MNSKATEGCYLACHLADVSDLHMDGVRHRVTLAPDGRVESKSGTFIVDEEAAGLVIAEFDSHGVMRPIDWEHQGLGGKYSSPSGQAPAAGWITQIQYQPGVGLVADVWWTPEARELIRAKKYLYISPVTVVRKKDLRAVEIVSAALTNTPAIPRMEALAAKYQPQKKETKAMADEPTGTATTTGPSPDMLVAEIKAYLGITVDENAPLMDVLKAIRDWAEKNKGAGEKGEGAKEGGAEGEGAEAKVASKAVCDAIGVKADASESEIIVALNTLTKGNESSVAANQRIAALEEEIGAYRAEKLMEPHIARGAINPNNAVDVQECRRLAMTDKAKFEHWVGSRPDGSMAPPPGRTTAPPRGAGSSREQVIANSRRGIKGRLADRDVFVNQALRDARLGELTDDERKDLRIP